MGASLGLLGTSNTEDDYEAVNRLPLPPPRVLSGVPVGTIGILLPTARPECIPPPELSFTRKSMNFTLTPGSIAIHRDLGRSCTVAFNYSSTGDLSVVAALVDERGYQLALTHSTARSHPSGRFSTKLDLLSDEIELSACQLKLELSDLRDKLSLSGPVQESGVAIKQSQLFLGEEGRTVDILNLYNSTSNSPSGGGDFSAPCTICLEGAATIGFLPCRHVCVCRACSDRTLSSSYNHCPICRNDVNGVIHLER